MGAHSAGAFGTSGPSLAAGAAGGADTAHAEPGGSPARCLLSMCTSTFSALH